MKVIELFTGCFEKCFSNEKKKTHTHVTTKPTVKIPRFVQHLKEIFRIHF
jgi:hypothetical protein